MTQVSIKVKGDKEVNRKIMRLIKTIKEPVSILKDVKLIMYRDVIDHFRDEKGSDGAWKPSQRVLKFGGKTLDRSGGRFGLKGSMTSDSGKDYAQVGSNKIYGKVHNEGLRVRNIKMPKREFLWLSENAQGKILNRFVSGLAKKVD